jgi:hypothetical protein
VSDLGDTTDAARKEFAGDQELAAVLGPDHSDPSKLTAMTEAERDAYLEFRAAAKALRDSATSHQEKQQRYREALERLSATIAG